MSIISDARSTGWPEVGVLILAILLAVAPSLRVSMANVAGSVHQDGQAHAQVSATVGKNSRHRSFRPVNGWSGAGSMCGRDLCRIGAGFGSVVPPRVCGEGRACSEACDRFHAAMPKPVMISLSPLTLSHPRPRGGDSATALSARWENSFPASRTVGLRAADAALLDPRHKGEDEGELWMLRINEAAEDVEPVETLHEANFSAPAEFKHAGRTTAGFPAWVTGVGEPQSLSPPCGGESKIKILAKPSLRFCKRGGCEAKGGGSRPRPSSLLQFLALWPRQGAEIAFQPAGGETGANPPPERGRGNKARPSPVLHRHTPAFSGPATRSIVQGQQRRTAIQILRLIAKPAAVPGLCAARTITVSSCAPSGRRVARPAASASISPIIPAMAISS